MSELQAVLQDYRVALLRYLPQREEAALTQGYQIGRAAFDRHVSLLHLTQIHHQVLLEVLAGVTPDEIAVVVEAAAEFLREVLAPYDMARRGGGRGADAATPGA